VASVTAKLPLHELCRHLQSNCLKVLELYLERLWHAACRARAFLGRFGYSDLKDAALRGRSYVFSIGLQRVVWIAGLVLRTV
jgi:hypothetical protein